jgi:hypothetical protein
MSHQRTVQLFVGYPACHSDPAGAGEESQIISLQRRHSSKERCFAKLVLSRAEGLNMTRKDGPELELQPARLPLQ